MTIGKKLARLNAKTVRFDVGAGGTSDLVPTDIAGALAFVDDDLGRDILCLIWWPAGATLREPEINYAVEQAMRAEWASREAAMNAALVNVIEFGPKARQQYSEATQRRWPSILAKGTASDPQLSEGYLRVRKGVLNEVAGAGLCPACAGRGEAPNDCGVVRKCPMCSGIGHHRMGERERASAAGIPWSTFANGGWRDVYDWTFQFCAERLHRAERQFAAALRDD